MLVNFIAFQIGWFACVLGAVAGPLAYYAGARLGGMSFADPLASLIAVGGVWTQAMPLLLVNASRWNGVAESDPANDALGTSATAGKPA